MATATKVYYCQICENDGNFIEPYNRKQYFRHIKSNDHKDKAAMSRCKVNINVKQGIIEKSGKRKKIEKKNKTIRKGNEYIKTLSFFHNEEMENCK